MKAEIKEGEAAAEARSSDNSGLIYALQGVDNSVSRALDEETISAEKCQSSTPVAVTAGWKINGSEAVPGSVSSSSTQHDAQSDPQWSKLWLWIQCVSPRCEQAMMIFTTILPLLTHLPKGCQGVLLNYLHSAEVRDAGETASLSSFITSKLHFDMSSFVDTFYSQPKWLSGSLQALITAKFCSTWLTVPWQVESILLWDSAQMLLTADLSLQAGNGKEIDSSPIVHTEVYWWLQA
ncbi:hypothetical protein PAMP_021274 [Pampus punctatissimus]